MTTRTEILRLVTERGSLKDSELVRLLGVSHQQVNQAARGLAADGYLARVAGPDGVIRNHPGALKGTLPLRPGRSGRRVQAVPKEPPVLGAVAVGTPVAREELRLLGFVEHVLHRVPSADVPEAGLIGWDTLGDVPRAPGLYCFVGRHGAADDLRVFYVGMTTHLWMVTKGQLPGGVARGGQRYGRPKHAGETRRRVNSEVSRMSMEGWSFTHWLQAVEDADGQHVAGLLRGEEARLIRVWKLRDDGWNRA